MPRKANEKDKKLKSNTKQSKKAKDTILDQEENVLIDKEQIKKKSSASKDKLSSILDAILNPVIELPPDEELTRSIKKSVQKATTKAKNRTKKVSKKVSDDVHDFASEIHELDSLESTILHTSLILNKTEDNKSKGTYSVKKTKAEKIDNKDLDDTPEKIVKVSKTKSKSSDKKAEKKKPIILEYYDLPYKYNKTVVKVLAQNPNTLFVYWEISDIDKERFSKKYGKDFFQTTKPVLLIKNLTDGYEYELEINDFANNWYIHVNDSKCKYEIELGRKPIDSNNATYYPITESNVMESPNDHVLFFKDGDRIVFKNIYTNRTRTRLYRSDKYGANVSALYKDYHLENNRFDYRNPSSQNPTSNVM